MLTEETTQKLDWDQVRREIEYNLEFTEEILDKYYGDEYPKHKQTAYPIILEFLLKLSSKSF